MLFKKLSRQSVTESVFVMILNIRKLMTWNIRNFLHSLKQSFEFVFFLCTAFSVIRKNNKYIWIFHLVERLSCLLQRGELGSYVGQNIIFKREYNNKHDRFAVAGEILLKGRSASITVRHVPRELSRHTFP